MKALLIGLLLLSNLSVSSAQTVRNSDGLTTIITSAEFSRLLEWANDTKKELSYLKENIRIESSRRVILDNYESSLNEIVNNDLKLNALAMRKYLNRSNIINSLVQSSSRGRDAERFRIKVFELMVDAATKSYVSDIDFLRNSVRDEGKEISDLVNLFLKLNILAGTKGTKIKTKTRNEIFKKFVGFISRDVFESSYAQENAFELKKIRKILGQEYTSLGDIKRLLFLLKKMSRSINPQAGLVREDRIIKLENIDRKYNPNFETKLDLGAELCKSFLGGIYVVDSLKLGHRIRTNKHTRFISIDGSIGNLDTWHVRSVSCTEEIITDNFNIKGL